MKRAVQTQRDDLTVAADVGYADHVVYLSDKTQRDLGPSVNRMLNTVLSDVQGGMSGAA